MTHALSTALLWTSLFGPAPTVHAVAFDGGQWTTQCAPNAESCRVTQDLYAGDARIHLSVQSRGETLILTILTSPLQSPRAHVLLDRLHEIFIDTDECGPESCAFAQTLDPTSKKFMFSGTTLEIEVLTQDGQTVAFGFEVKPLELALRRLPVGL